MNRKRTKPSTRGPTCLNHVHGSAIIAKHEMFLNSSAAFKQEVFRRLAREAGEFKEPVVHALDGKPLTAHGAALLGVPWDEAANARPALQGEKEGQR